MTNRLLNNRVLVTAVAQEVEMVLRWFTDDKEAFLLTVYVCPIQVKK